MGNIYKTVTEITDWGPQIIKIIIPLPETVESGALSPSTFSVYVEKRDSQTGETVMARKSWTSPETFPLRGQRIISDIYTSDANGSRTDSGSFASIEMAYGPIHPLGSVTANRDHNVFAFCDYRITQLSEIATEGGAINGLVYDKFVEDIKPQAEGWINSSSTDEKMPMRYGYYSPKIGGGRRPLIIWLHGAGEGGLDTSIAYLGNKVVALSSEKIQKMFGGAYVLAPQIPTMWMDDGSGQYTQSGKSKYVEGLKALIDEFVGLHSNIDTDRIYIGGCSNGGFMTMRMIIDYPGFFAAAYPICEALYDAVITDEDIDSIKDTPIWFTHAKNDTIVKPEVTVIPTYERLIKAGAKNVHFSFFDNVVDTTGLFKDEDGNPYEYFGHGSWIYTLNDECTLDYDGSPVQIDGKDITLLNWLSKQ